MLGRPLGLGKLLGRDSVGRLSKLLVRPDRLLLLPDSLEATSTAGRPVAAALLTNHWHPLCVDGLTGVPVRISASVHALVAVEVSYEVALILLRPNDASLRCRLASAVDQLIISGVLRRSVVESRILISGVEQSSLRIGRIQSRLIVLLGMEQEGFQTERLTFESAVLNVIVGWSVVHQLLHRSLRLVTVEDCLGGTCSLAGADLRLRDLLLLNGLMLWLWLGHELRGLRVLLLLAHRLGEHRSLCLPHLRLLLWVRL